MVVIEDKLSEYDETPIIHLTELYIYPQYRGKGYGKKAIEWIKKKFNKRIEWECYYNAPAMDFYEHLGADKLEVRYALN